MGEICLDKRVAQLSLTVHVSMGVRGLSADEILDKLLSSNLLPKDRLKLEWNGKDIELRVEGAEVDDAYVLEEEEVVGSYKNDLEDIKEI